ncbi:MAG TPA: helix-turn-helix domain-containing protein, partial [Pyrinomonadaceae bacterium]|nr:helix-turn-helix domain-containing protein [Pyrinomonadaceae bacterium]
VIPFQVPALRERLEDVPLLVEFFNEKFSAAYAKERKRFEPDAIAAMQNYSWPGNVRELRNTVERVVIMHPHLKVTAADLPPLGGEAPPEDAFRFSTFKDASEAHQREFIKRKLAEAEGNVSRAAELMGMDRSHLYRRMRTLGINVRGERAGTT